MKKIFTVVVMVFLFLPAIALATSDLGFKVTSVRFASNKEKFISGNKERVYVSVSNYGTEDASGTVIIYRDVQVIAEKPVSVLAQGFVDEVYADFVVPEQPFRIYFELKGVEPADQNSSNNQFLAQLYEVDIDTDRDGIGNSVDNDDDNDGLTDSVEDSLGTDPLRYDTDGDGVNDALDAYPLDPSKNKKELPKIEPVKEVPQAEVRAPVKTEATKKNVEPVKKEIATEPVTLVNQEKELVSEFYQSPQVTLLNQINIKAQQVNWNTFDFSFSTNLPDLDLDKLEYYWDYGDGSNGNKIGHHTFKKTGDYYITLKVKGPWDSYFYDNVKVNVAFWSLYNYWLWLFGLAIALAFILLGTGFKHHDNTVTIEEKTIAKRVKKEPKNKKVEDDKD